MLCFKEGMNFYGKPGAENKKEKDMETKA